MTRTKAIALLTEMYIYYTNDCDSPVPFDDEDREALKMAIDSLKTDEAYHLEYEGRDVVDVIRCRDCKYFEYDSISVVNGIPLISGHLICSRWAGGCKTMEDGYCHLAKRK